MKTQVKQFIYTMQAVWAGYVVICLCLGLSVSAGAERGLSLGTQKKRVVDQEGEEVLLYRESHALVIGISDYTVWPKLPGVREDVGAVKAALEAQGFHVVVAMDVDKVGLDAAFSDFISEYGDNPDNRLLFYFAGHGHTVKTSYGEELGYIVPVNAPNPHDDLSEFQRSAIEMQQIEIYAKRVQSKHALFLFDACFSGSLFALSRAVPEIINYKTAQPVRQFITSGSAEETVPDKSIFRAQFVRALQGEADSNQDGYVTGTELGDFLQNTVVNYSRNAQHPQYGKIRNPNLDKGDFVFKLTISMEVEVSAPDDGSPGESTFSLNDLEDASVQEKADWEANLAEMEEAFAQVEEFERGNRSDALKITAWDRFLTAFEKENPYSTRDDELRRMAEARKTALSEQETAKTPTPKRSILSALRRKGLSFAVVGSFKRLEEARQFARTLQKRKLRYEPEIYYAENDYYAVTLGGYLREPQAKIRVLYARKRGIATDAYVWKSARWGKNLFHE